MSKQSLPYGLARVKAETRHNIPSLPGWAWRSSAERDQMPTDVRQAPRRTLRSPPLFPSVG